ncbi:hypothetical protein BU17DRAFT_87961 [Hysterangium stoloniferum]|nr:hypothetical protein BU17DRAFT_87961 [Hysterangium stoloniferum]
MSNSVSFLLSDVTVWRLMHWHGSKKKLQGSQSAKWIKSFRCKLPPIQRDLYGIRRSFNPAPLLHDHTEIPRILWRTAELRISRSSRSSIMIGPLFVGLTLSIGFEGILLFQGYLYWRAYHKKDTVVYQSLVYALCLLELFHSIVTVHAGYWYLVVNFGKPEQLVKLVWSIIVELALTVVISFIGRAGPRFWIGWLFACGLSPNLLYQTTVLKRTTSEQQELVADSAFSLAQLVLGILEVYEGIRSPLISTIVDGKAAVITQMIAADLGDLIISLSLSYYLRKHRTGIRKTELMLDRIIMFVVTRGFLTSGMGALQLITYVIWPKAFVFGIFHLIASKLYTNSLLATLNSREYIAGRIATRDEPGTAAALSFATASSQANKPETYHLVDKRSEGRFSDLKSPAHTVSSPTSSGTTSGVQTSSAGRLHSDIDSIPTYHASLRDV